MTKNTRQAGQSYLGAIVALAFITLCLIFGYIYLAKDENARQAASTPKETRASEDRAARTQAAVDITFCSSSAKKSWIEQAVKDFNARRFTTKGKLIKVHAKHVLSGDSLEDLKAGRIQPHIWSPGDESWLTLADEYWRDVKGKPLFDGFTPLLDVPLVIAMWEPMATAIGYPNPVGWSDILKLARNPQGWADYGHPEWGRFRWGHAHPDANSGFLSVASLAYAASGKSSGLTADDLKQPAVVSFIKDAESSVEHYGLSNDFIDKLMREKGPAYLSAAVQYENTIIESNINSRNLPFKLTAVYPREGSFRTRHPAAILKESWVDTESADASRVFIDFLISDECQRSAMSRGLRPISGSIKPAPPFTLENGVVEQLPHFPIFSVPPQSVLQRVRNLWEDVKLPATIAVVIDRSGSMNGEPILRAKEGAAAFIKSMKPRDRLELVVFSDAPQVLAPNCMIRECGEQTLTRLQGIFASGNTMLYDTILMSYGRLLESRKSDPKRRYGMVVLSDGQDTGSAVNIHDFLDSLPKSEDVGFPKIFTIAYGAEADKQALSKIAGKTNARMFAGDPRDIVKIYQELSANF